MNKQELIEHIIANSKESDVVSESQIRRIVNQCFASIKHGINTDGEVRIVGFGTFDRVFKKSRKGVNPRTKESLDISGRNRVRFKASATVKKMINANESADDSQEGEE